MSRGGRGPPPAPPGRRAGARPWGAGGARGGRRAPVDMPDPAPAELFEHVYTSPHPLITEQRRAYTEYLAGDPGGASARGEGVPR